MIFKNSKLAIAVLASLVLALILLLTFSFYRIEVQNRETTELLEKADGEARERDLFHSLKRLQDDEEGDIKVFESMVFSNDEVVTAIETLEETAGIFGLGIEITSVEETLAKEGVEMSGLTLSISSTGSWANNFRFLKAVEALPYRVVFENVSWSKTETGWLLSIKIFLPTFK